MRKNTTRTFSINDDVYTEFNKYMKDNNINKSKLVESLIIDYLKEKNGIDAIRDLYEKTNNIL